MQSKSSKFIIVALVLAVIGAGVYFFVIKKDTVATVTGLVSSKTGLAQGLATSGQDTSVGQSATGAQVVTILRNLSAIKLDDSVFRNPAFTLLTDISISLPPITNQGRRNPFAPVGADPIVSAPLPSVGAGTTIPTGGPSF